MAAAWALKKTKHFTLWSPNMILAVDHKPLLRILGDKSLQDIDNPRLLHFKEKTLSFRFSCVHVPGKLNKGADFGSRNPSQTQDDRGEHEDHDDLEDRHLPAVQPSVEEQEETALVEQNVFVHIMSSIAGMSWEVDRVQSLTLDRIRAASTSDTDIRAVNDLLKRGYRRPPDMERVARLGTGFFSA